MTRTFRLALHGGLFSGKTTLAKALVERAGFAWVNYTDIIKEFAAQALATCGVEVTVAKMHQDKERYRPFLIALGTLLDFDNGYGIDDLVEMLGDRQRVVFDNVRFPGQWAKLQPAGFRLVRIETDISVRLARAKAAGLTTAEFFKRIEQQTERPLDPQPGEISLEVDGDMNRVIDTLTAKLLEAELHERLAALATK